jgi:DNA topoisomerase I
VYNPKLGKGSFTRPEKQDLRKKIMKLVLVESPTKARKLTGYLGQEYVVRASVGHIRDLPKSKMGVDIEHGFEPEYLVPKDKAKVVKELKILAGRADQIILATDPDREGEAIGWHLREILAASGDGKTAKKVKKAEGEGEPVVSPERFVRATFHEITKSAILDAINHPTTLNMALVDAQQARRVLDRLVGYSVSPVLWKKIRYGLSAGRVQSVALRLIVEREREIENFKPDEYWEVDVLLNTQKITQPHPLNGDVIRIDSYFQNNTFENVPEGMFVARVVELQQAKYDPKKETDVQPLLPKLQTATYIIKSVEKKERRRTSLPPFTTSTLQQQASTRFGYTSKNTMRMAQGLYEEGLITYHRTDSVNLSQQSLEMAQNYIRQEFGPQYLPASPRIFSTKTKNAQEAHEAIRPTDTNIDREYVQSKLSDQHAKVYDLIWRRFIASQMESAVYDQTTVLVQAKGQGSSADLDATLKATGSTLKFDGWMKLFPNQGDILLPSLEENQPVNYVETNAAQKFTQPPPRFNDASLIKTLESEGIGRPSTYASIISVIEDRGYVERKEKKFYPTPIGCAVNDFLTKYFMTIMDYKFTANMEDDLDAISRGEKDWKKIVSDFYTPLNKTIQEVVDTADRAQIPTEKTGQPCPKCGESEHGEVVIRAGKFGKFKSCSRFPQCDFTENIVNKVDGVKCPLCQEGDVVIKPTRYGKDFYSCTRYPGCTWASWSKPAPETRITPEQWAIQQAERAERQKVRLAQQKNNPTAKSSARTAKIKKAPAKRKKKPAAKSTKKKTKAK